VKLLPLDEHDNVHPTDPFDAVAKFPMGKYKGRVIDTSLKRPAKIVYESDNEILFANFRDGNQFHQAHVSKNGVETVYFRINRFPSGVKNITPAHTLLYFKMKPGSEIILEGGGNAQDLSHPHAVSDVVFSTDFAGPEHERWDALGGLIPNLLTVMDFSSAYDYSIRPANRDFPVEYLKLDLTDGEKNQLLKNAIHESDERGYNYVYDLLLTNCTTEIFDLLDATVDYPEPVKPFVVSVFNAKDPVSGPSKDALVKRGLVHKNDDGSLPIVWANHDGTLPH
jgi:hypothetical protein